MRFQPVHKQSVSDSVFTQLRGAIVDGALTPGTLLPPERDLAETFGVNRHAVREATKRLHQAGLVEVVHGGGTRVLDFRHTAGLDLLPYLVSGTAPLELLRSSLEMRRCVGVEVARLAAVRASDEARVAITACADRYANPGDTHIRYVDREFWALIVDAAGNIAFQLALNSLVRFVDEHPEVTDIVLADDYRDVHGHQAIALAIANRDSARATETAHLVLTGALVLSAKLGDPTSPIAASLRAPSHEERSWST